MPKNVFIGFESPVPPSASPAATRRPSVAFSASFAEAKMYQPSASWHHMQNAVERQCSPAAAIAWIAAPRSTRGLRPGRCCA
jgi:hypothetical protein